MNTSLVNFRVTKGLSQSEMAKTLGTSLSLYAKVETGIRTPSYNFISKLKSKFPEIIIDEIFFAS